MQSFSAWIRYTALNLGDLTRRMCEERRELGVRWPRACRTTMDVKAIRKKVGLTQEGFAPRCSVRLASLWEQRRYAPDQTARAYLTIVHRDPVAVERWRKSVKLLEWLKGRPPRARPT